MELNDYQKAAMGTCMPSSNNFAYMILNLQGEVGEFCSKVAKAIRKEQAYIGEIKEEELDKYNEQHPDDEMTAENHLFLTPEAFERLDVELKKEAGDILWQLSGLCSVFGWSLEDVARMNLAKLSARKEAGTIDGNGDGVSGKERTV